MQYFITILATAILLVVMVLLVSAKPRLSKLITIWALIIATVGGLLVYGYGYMDVTDNYPLAILSALLAVCGSFVGADEYTVIPTSEALETPLMQILCTCIRICALYVTASTVITAIGAGALQRLRLWMSRRGSLNLIYGNADDAPEFARELLENKQGSVVFVVDRPEESYTTAIADAGCVLRTDPHSQNADTSFLRSIGLGRRRRKVTLYALDRDNAANLHYAKKLLASLESRGANPQDLQLVLLGKEDTATHHLQAAADTYGYGSVTVVHEPQMAARLLTRKHPPCHSLSFDENGHACQDFQALVIGFGQVGQEVLKSLIMNGQFSGSQFRATVICPDWENLDGSFTHRTGQLTKQYPIEFLQTDARSKQFYEYLTRQARQLKYVAVCTGDGQLNREIAQELLAYFADLDMKLPIYLCNRRGVEVCMPDGNSEIHSIYCMDVLHGERLDAMAMVLNHRYQADTEKTPQESWLTCDYFSRQSCRTSADFVPAMLYAVGKTPAEAASNWSLTEAQLENLSITEHLRWCAFHYCMGFSPMSDAEFSDRAETYLRQKQDGQKPLRITKNMQNRTHACLIPWDALDALSEKEAAVTGNYVDYKALDAQNVLAVGQLLQIHL